MEAYHLIFMIILMILNFLLILRYLPKVRSDIREYLKEGKNGISRLSLLIFLIQFIKKIILFVYGIKFGIFETMYSGGGSEILYRDIGKTLVSNSKLLLGKTKRI